MYVALAAVPSWAEHKPSGIHVRSVTPPHGMGRRKLRGLTASWLSAELLGFFTYSSSSREETIARSI